MVRFDLKLFEHGVRVSVSGFYTSLANSTSLYNTTLEVWALNSLLR